MGSGVTKNQNAAQPRAEANSQPLTVVIAPPRELERHRLAAHRLVGRPARPLDSEASGILTSCGEPRDPVA
jgi:hypothetical protein